jgi:tRNA threonylcarbamoyladenosine biosynthesis protein TsaB
MTVLGLETSSRICSVGLAADNRPSAVLSLDAGSIHSEKLLTLIASLLRNCAMQWRDIDGVAVSSGPGSFTGLRIGFSAAKGLCFSSGKPFAVVSTFEALARNVSRSRKNAGNIVVALDAKKGDFYVEKFRKTDGEMVPEDGIRLLRVEDLPGFIRLLSRPLIVTDAESHLHSMLADIDAETEEARTYFRGDEIAALGLQKILSGAAADAAEAEPLYLKNFAVTGRPPAV